VASSSSVTSTLRWTDHEPRPVTLTNLSNFVDCIDFKENTKSLKFANITVYADQYVD